MFSSIFVCVETFLISKANIQKWIFNDDIISNKDLLKIKIDDYIYEIPNYLIQKKIPKNFDNLIIRKSLHFTRQVMQNKFFIPNNLIFPKSRIILENYFN